MQKGETQMQKVRKLIIFILCMCITATIVLRIIGIKSFAIKTESMLPTLSVDDMVYVMSTSFNDIKSGDIITYVIDEGTTITHRVVAVNSDDKTVVTQGDNNQYPDIAPVEEENIIGKMIFKIPKLGKLDFLNNLVKNLKGDD